VSINYVDQANALTAALHRRIDAVDLVTGIASGLLKSSALKTLWMVRDSQQY